MPIHVTSGGICHRIIAMTLESRPGIAGPALAALVVDYIDGDGEPQRRRYAATHVAVVWCRCRAAEKRRDHGPTNLL